MRILEDVFHYSELMYSKFEYPAVKHQKLQGVIIPIANASFHRCLETSPVLIIYCAELVKAYPIFLYPCFFLSYMTTVENPGPKQTELIKVWKQIQDFVILG